MKKQILTIIVLIGLLFALDKLHQGSFFRLAKYSVKHAVVYKGQESSSDFPKPPQSKPYPRDYLLNKQMNPNMPPPGDTFLKRITTPGMVEVLMYHHVGDTPVFADAIRRDLTVSIKDFDDQISLLDKLGYHTITTSQLYDALTAGAQLPSKPVVVTFDDGYNDVFQNAVPILLGHHMIGTFAIITGFVGYKPEYADWSTIADAQSKGMEIISHSEHHMDFTDSQYNRVDKLSEMINSRDQIKQHLGIDTTSFIYPYGHFNADVQQIAREAGYKIAFTTQYGAVEKGQDLMAMPRIRVHGNQLLSTYFKNLALYSYNSVKTAQVFSH